MVIGTKELAAHAEVAERGLGEADLRSLAKAGVLPHSVVGGKFAFDLDDALAALDEHDGVEDGDADQSDGDLEDE